MSLLVAPTVVPLRPDTQLCDRCTMDVGDIYSFTNASERAVDISVVLPTFNERENIVEVIERLSRSLREFNWELIFVDDNSPDGTSDLVRTYCEAYPRIRLIQRIGRRGLSSACIEGMRAATAPYIAIMDADLQHDETVLPVMLSAIQTSDLDLVIGTRNSAGGSMGGFSWTRIALSGLGRLLSRAISHVEMSDPMSGFFVVRRSFFQQVENCLDGRGFKILLDMVSASTRRVKLSEVGYCFRARYRGESKLSAAVMFDYIRMLGKKLLRSPEIVRTISFAGVGTTGAALQLILLYLLYRVYHVGLVPAQIISILGAMLSNFILNDRFTFHGRTMRRLPAAPALLVYCNISCLGAGLNILTSLAMIHLNLPWQLAGISGIIVGAVWNYCMSIAVVWKVRHGKLQTAH